MFKSRMRRLEERVDALEKKTTPGMGESISFAPLIIAEISEGQSNQVISEDFAEAIERLKEQQKLQFNTELMKLGGNKAGNMPGRQGAGNCATDHCVNQIIGDLNEAAELLEQGDVEEALLNASRAWQEIMILRCQS